MAELLSKRAGMPAMIVEPDLLKHWKLRVLSDTVGELVALRGLLSLWSHCQARRQWIFKLYPEKLHAICAAGPGVSEEVFWEAMTGSPCHWLTHRGEEWWEVRGWAEMNRTLIAAWTARTKRLPWMDEYEGELPGAAPAIAWAKTRTKAGRPEREPVEFQVIP
jgi:hypothetical protein